MSELDTLLETWRGLDPARADAVLATVVHVTGSAYRRPGARMLVLPHGQRVGMISGGCLEGEISRKAWWFTESPRPVVRIYDTSSGDDAVWEFGLGCNGVVHVMLERVQAPETARLLAFLDARNRARETVVVATVIAADPATPVQVGERLFVDANGICGGALSGRAVAAELDVHARHALVTGSHLAHVSGCTVFVERVAPPLDLVVFGAGDDVVPLVSMAGVLSWRVTVADGRPAYARTDRFPAATRVFVLPRERPLADIEITTDTSVVVMTHNYPLDARLLPEILSRAPRYLGLLGPRQRAERLFEALGRPLGANVYAPAGLDVGGDNPAAVALSIISEVQAVAEGRTGAMLRLRDGAIHAPVDQIGNQRLAPSSDIERPAYCETLAGNHAA
jgi:xanthine/CO dehydrogenase XdhC/CoxF family maturation factor